jgi:hypothetical protein
MSYVVTYSGNGASGQLAPETQPVYWSNGDKRIVEKECIGFYQGHSDVFTVTPADDFVEDTVIDAMFTGAHAAAFIDFNTGAAEAGCKITIGGVDYQEADVAVPANGVWTNGASAANSAASFKAAVNGDTRAPVPFTAVSDLSGDGCWLFWDAVGETNPDITTTSAARVTVPESATGGLNPVMKKVWNCWHTVTSQELLSGAIEIPLPFSVESIVAQVRSATGAPKYITSLITIEPDPVRLRIRTNGATNAADTDVIHVILVG